VNYLINSREYAVLNGVPLQTPAWVHHNLWELWSGPAVRGGDVTVPHAQGVRPYPRVIDARKVVFELSILGDVDWQGIPNFEPRLGLWNNVEHLRAATRPPGTGDGTVLLEAMTPAGRRLSGLVVVEGFLLGGDLGETATKATIDVVLVSGELRDVT
jgi:hypothetical protein